jgi:multidrug efflux pump subunit AcrA (membrane-fusion protein)
MRVGSRLRAEIVTGSIKGAIVLPSQAVYGDGDGAYVFVMHGRRSERRPVRLGHRSPDRVEITAGVEPGERVSLVPPGDGR